MKDLKKQIQRITETSGFIKCIKTVKERKESSALFESATRKLSKAEISVLKQNGNHCDDWSLIMVTKDFSPERIINSFFFGKCIIGNFSILPTTPPPGIYNSTIVNSEIGNNVLIHNCGAVINYIIKDNVVIQNTHSVSQSGTGTFGNGVELAIGIETGGRDVLSFAELTIDTAARIATERENKKLIDTYVSMVDKYTALATSGRGIVEKGAKILNSVKVANSFIGEYALIDGALLIEN